MSKLSDGLNGTITLTSIQYRPCTVNGEKALFHEWEHYSEIVPPSLLNGGHGGGVLQCSLGIVEFADGRVRRFKPEDIRFADNIFKEFAFNEYQEPEQERRSELTEQEKVHFAERKIRCPFCEGDNENAVLYFDGQAKEYFVYCRTCGIETADVFRSGGAAIKAFAAGKNNKIHNNN